MIFWCIILGFLTCLLAFVVWTMFAIASDNNDEMKGRDDE